MAIVMQVDPYTAVIVPNIRGPTSYQKGYGFKISIGELSKIDEYEHPEIKSASGVGAGFLESAGRVKVYALSGSGNVLHLYAYYQSGGAGASGLVTQHWRQWEEVASGFGLSHLPLTQKVYGH